MSLPYQIDPTVLTFGWLLFAKCLDLLEECGLNIRVSYSHDPSRLALGKSFRVRSEIGLVFTDVCWLRTVKDFALWGVASVCEGLNL